MSSDTDEEITAEDVIALPSSDEGFEGEAVPVLIDVVTDRLRDYVTQQANNDEPVSLLGFSLELVYQTGYQDGKARKR